MRFQLATRLGTINIVSIYDYGLIDSRTEYSIYGTYYYYLRVSPEGGWSGRHIGKRNNSGVGI